MRRNLLIVLFSLTITISSASVGDRTPFYGNCIESCVKANCTKRGIRYQDKSRENSVDQILLWTCKDECRYQCMWKTINAFIDREWKVPQFHGKWPFKRIFGMQEPASVIFSLLNLIGHAWGIRKFRREVARESPYYYMWHTFAGICINAWFWSTIFHTRDTPNTELLDYGCAYSMVIASFYCMVARIAALYKKHYSWSAFLAAVVFGFFMNHFVYLTYFQDYTYNMQVNIATGTAAGMGWIVWYLNQRKQKPYAWKIAVFVILSAASLAWEVFDFPPLWYIFDPHSLWHLNTAPLVILLYSFIIDDCKYLLKQEQTKLHAE